MRVPGPLWPRKTLDVTDATCPPDQVVGKLRDTSTSLRTCTSWPPALTARRPAPRPSHPDQGGSEATLAGHIFRVERDARPTPESRYIAIQQEPLNCLGSVTSTQRQFPLQGLWQSGPDVFQDRVVVITVMDFRTDTQFLSLRCLERLKTRLKRKFEQLEILIIVQKLLAI
jgi:hypothetical protein